MKLQILAAIVSLMLISGTCLAETPSPSQVEQEISALEKEWATAIQRQDIAAMDHFLSPRYALSIAVQGGQLKVIPRAAWLDTLKAYETKNFTIDDLKVHVYGDTAIVLMLFTQQALVRGQDRSGQFLITDVWVKDTSGWHVAERHSSRPEPVTVTRP